MPFVQNSDTLKELRDVAQLQLGAGDFITEMGRAVIPVMEINPKLLQVTTVIKSYEQDTTGANVTVYAVPADQDFYITHAYLDWYQDVTANPAADTKIKLNVTLDDGTTQSIISTQCPTLTAIKENINVDFSRPIKVARGTNIIGNSPTFAAGKVEKRYCVMGYLVRNVRG